MTGLERALRMRRDRGEVGLVPYLTAGFPDEPTSLALMQACVARGCEVIEVGVPFSDPVADGPVIQRAGQRALEQGMTLRRALHLVREVVAAGGRPVIMTYLNPVLRLGFAEFATAARAAGCAGVIVPDLSHEESGDLRRALAGEGLPLVDLVAPTTTPERLGRIAGPAAGFLYLVAVAGVTGTRSATFADLAALAARVREHTDVPLNIGFGIDGPDRAREAARVADGVIVGSALLRRLLEAPTTATGVEATLALIDELLAALMDPARRTHS
ncbi:tryptophan synthase subunit alpha [bacterium]|nr:tryptophan synthase subunit alpha [bacterium]